VGLYYPTTSFRNPLFTMPPKRKRVRGKQSAPLKKTNRGPRQVFWVFTDNGTAGTYGKELVPEAWKTLPAGVRYITWQYERADQGQLHLQGYLELIKAQYVSWLHANISATAGFLVRKGTQEQAVVYVQKEESRVQGPWSLGTKTRGKGMRTDLDAFRDAISAGSPMRDLQYNHLVCLAKYPRLYHMLRPLARPVRRKGQGVQVTLCFGKPGTGKTRSIYDQWEDSPQFYRIPSCRSGGIWMNGYDFHEKVLLDEFAGRSSHMRLDRLLEITDRYPLRLETKGGFCWFHPTHLAITTTLHPRYWYDWGTRGDFYIALQRRIHKVLLFVDCDTPPTEAGEDFWTDPDWDLGHVDALEEEKLLVHQGPFLIHRSAQPKKPAKFDFTL